MSVLSWGQFIKNTTRSTLFPGLETSRLDVLKAVINQHIPIELVDGSTVIIDEEMSGDVIHEFLSHDLNTLQPRFKQLEFRTTCGKRVAINKIVKSAIFGGASGTLPDDNASARTEMVECMHAACMGLRMRLGRPISDIDVETRIHELVSEYSGSKSISEIAAFSKSNPSWTKSAILTANALWKYLMPGATVHCNSAWVDRLKQDFFVANRADREFSQINRWNPADVWIVVDNIRLNAPSISELNDQLDLLFKATMVTPVSLKQVRRSAKVEVLNGSTSAENYHKVTEFNVVGRRGDLFGTKHAFARCHPVTAPEQEYVMFFRSSNLMTDVGAELKLKHARGGRVSLKQINNILTSYGIETQIPTVKDLIERAGGVHGQVNPAHHSWHLSQLQEHVIVVHPAKCIARVLDDIEACKCGSLSVSESHLYSKLQAVMITSAIASVDDITRYCIISDIYTKASSTDDRCAVFVKVSEE